MANLYSKVHRLKSLGWTWQHFLGQIDSIYPAGIDEKTLFSLYRHPHRKASSHVNNLITTLHEREFPSPFPNEIESLLSLYNRRIFSDKHKDNSQDTSDLLCFLEKDVEYGSALRRARLHWLIADIHLDKIPNFRNNGQSKLLNHAKDHALRHYQNCYRLLIQEMDEQTIDSFTLYKVKQNMLACYLNSLHATDRYQDQSLLEYLDKTDFINASKAVLDKEPYQWIIARNGLRFSAITKNLYDCKFFFDALISSNKAFKNPNYKPLDAPAIKQSEQFAWAIQHLKL